MRNLIQGCFKVLASADLWVLVSQKCACCGVPAGRGVCDFSPCPHCNHMFGRVSGRLLLGDILPLKKCLFHSVPVVKLIGMIVAVAIRDAVDEIRIIGCKGNGPSECPWETSHRSWQILMVLQGQSYEMVPPPELLGAQLFLVLREIGRHTRTDAKGRGSFRIAIDDLSQSAELAMEDAEDEQVARIYLVGARPHAESAIQPYLQRLSKRAGKSGNPGNPGENLATQ